MNLQHCPTPGGKEQQCLPRGHPPLLTVCKVGEHLPGQGAETSDDWPSCPNIRFTLHIGLSALPPPERKLQGAGALLTAESRGRYWARHIAASSAQVTPLLSSLLRPVVSSQKNKSKTSPRKPFHLTLHSLVGGPLFCISSPSCHKSVFFHLWLPFRHFLGCVVCSGSLIEPGAEIRPPCLKNLALQKEG